MAKPKLAYAGHLLGWFPEVLRLGSHRIRGQVRLLGLAALVGIVAGLGGIAFYVATRAVEHYALGFGPATTRSPIRAVSLLSPGWV